MSRAANPFSPGKVAALVLVGASAFLLFLYAIGAGWTGDNQRSVTAHANSNALNGFSGLVALLERSNYDIDISRNRASQQSSALMILTPGSNTDPEELQALMENRRYVGPTLVILPKWMGLPLPSNAPDGTPSDWVQLGSTFTPMWFEQVEDFEPMELAFGQTQGWRGIGMEGDLPQNKNVQAIIEIPNKELFALVTDSEGDLLAGYWNRGGYHPDLAQAADLRFSEDEEFRQNSDTWPLVIVAEPDLMNNYGLADRDRAFLALRLVELAMEDTSLPIVFDMTMAGFDGSENLLTLAFRPPFLAATLCLLFVLAVIGWRAFRRFGPPLAQEPAMARGKMQLARNGAALVERAKRWHLLGTPYAALVAARIAKALNIHEPDEQAREAAIDLAMEHHAVSGPRFSEKANALRNARRPADIMRAANALRSIERMLIR